MMNTISTELIPFQYYIDFGTTEKAKLKVTAEAVWPVTCVILVVKCGTL